MPVIIEYAVRPRQPGAGHLICRNFPGEALEKTGKFLYDSEKMEFGEMGAMIVAKFGGTSLASAERFSHVASIIRGNPNRRYVVVSAPGKRCPEDV